jgi:hypothetical protein
MLDLLAAISSVDPPSLLAWLVLAFAASGYPLGIMLGSSCSPCCGFPPGQPCGNCETGTPPAAISVVLNGFVDGQTKGSDLLGLEFSSDFGVGAAGVVLGPGETAGPITAASITYGGEGYARLGRIAPTVTATAPGGSGAVLSVSLEQVSDVNIYQNDGQDIWVVDSVTVEEGGAGYSDGAPLYFASTNGVEGVAAAAAARTNRVQPTLTANVSSDTGSDATLSVTLTQTTDYGGRAVWTVSSISASNGGTDYVEGDPVLVTVTDGQESGYSYFSASVSSVDGGGAITGITIDYGGEYFKDGGVVQYVEVSNGGAYYKEDEDAPANLAAVTISILKLDLPASGSGDNSFLRAISGRGRPISAHFPQTAPPRGAGVLARAWCRPAPP